MSRQEIFEKLNVIFRDIFDDDSIELQESTTAEDVDGWDSLVHITLIATVEEEFGIKFKMKDVVSMKNVGDMVTTIEREL